MEWSSATVSSQLKDMEDLKVWADAFIIMCVCFLLRSDRYIGCYKDKDFPLGRGRILNGELNNAEMNSNGRCIRECASQNYTFAGTEVRAKVHLQK